MTSKNNTKYLSAVMMMVTITTFILVSQEVGSGSLTALFSSSGRGSQKKGCSRRILLPVHFGASMCQHLLKA